MKRFLLSAVMATIALASVSANAALPGPQTADFDVNINLTTNCIISTAPSAVSFTYTAFQTSASALVSNGSYGVSCSKNLSYTMSLDGSGSYTDNATDLAYTLSVPSTAKIGSGAEQTYAITGSMAASQSGTCAASAASCDNSAATNKTRTLTVAY